MVIGRLLRLEGGPIAPKFPIPGVGGGVSLMVVTVGVTVVGSRASRWTGLTAWVGATTPTARVTKELVMVMDLDEFASCVLSLVREFSISSAPSTDSSPVGETEWGPEGEYPCDTGEGVATMGLILSLINTTGMGSELDRSSFITSYSLVSSATAVNGPEAGREEVQLTSGKDPLVVVAMVTTMLGGGSELLGCDGGGDSEGDFRASAFGTRATVAVVTAGAFDSAGRADLGALVMVDGIDNGREIRRAGTEDDTGTSSAPVLGPVGLATIGGTTSE